MYKQGLHELSHPSQMLLLPKEWKGAVEALS